MQNEAGRSRLLEAPVAETRRVTGGGRHRRVEHRVEPAGSIGAAPARESENDKEAQHGTASHRRSGCFLLTSVERPGQLRSPSP